LNPAAQFLLEDCFWRLCDAGIAPEKTPLLTGVVDGTPLSSVVSARFGVSREEAETEIMAARNEVEL
jgi:hypothetical protein